MCNYKVFYIEDSDYMMNDGNRKVYQRHEIFKVVKHKMNIDKAKLKTNLKRARTGPNLFRTSPCLF